ncbi:MAG: hypothetical protein AAF726_07800 [Planctomycetota bacterium]
MTARSETVRPFEELADAKRLLEEGLALLDGAARADADVPAAIGRIVDAMRAARDPRELRAAVAPEDLERFDDAAEDVLRLNAVLTAAVVRDRSALMAHIETARTSRLDLARRSAGAVESGTHCDVSG